MKQISAQPIFRAFLALIVFAGTLAGCGDNRARSSEFAAIAEQHLSAGDLVSARLNAQKAIAERDDVAALYVLLGQIEVRSQKPISAFNAYSMALDLEADNIEVLQAIADLGMQTGRVKEAKEAADRILILAPASPNALLVKGFIAQDEGKYEEAAKVVEDILSLNAQDEGGIILSARLDALQGRSQQALEKIDKAIAQIGTTYALNVTRLEIYRLLGNAEYMLGIFPTILKEADINSEYQIDYTNIIYKTGNVGLARTVSINMLRDQQLSRAQLEKLTNLWVEYDINPLTEAQIAYFSAEGSPLTRSALTRHFLLYGKPETAERLLANLVEGGSEDAKALWARVMLARGNYRTAFAVAKYVLKGDPRNEDALLVHSAQSIAQRRFRDAIEDASVAVSDSPQNPIAYAQLAKAYAAKGNDVRARQVFEQGMDALPQSRLLASLYKKFLLKWGDEERALSIDKDVALASPSSTKSWTTFFQTCSRSRDTACGKVARDGLARAKLSFLVDDAPGMPRRRGLFARITPEKICATTGGICTES